MAVEHFTPDIDGDENLVQIAALTPTDNAVIIGNGAAWTAESGATLRTSLGLGIGTDVMAYDADLADWAGVNPSSYLTTAAAASTYLTQANAATTYQPLAAALTSWGGVTRAANFDTFAATPTSANLRALLSDESGSGALLFAGGALGTPASGVLTNCTGLPNASVVGLGTAALVADNTLVHLAGSETLTGDKTLSGSGTRLAFVGAAGGYVGTTMRYNSGTLYLLAADSSDGFTINRGGTDIFYIGRSSGTAAVFTGTLSAGSQLIADANGLLRRRTYTVGTLPSATGISGAMAFVTDSNTATFAASPSGGGGIAIWVSAANNNWYVG